MYSFLQNFTPVVYFFLIPVEFKKVTDSSIEIYHKR